jgi:hypothetical protein
MTAVYTHGHHESVLRSHRWRTAENSAAYLLPNLKPHMAVLDVGSGPGMITADLAARVGRLTATEVTAEALELARAEGPPRPAPAPTGPDRSRCTPAHPTARRVDSTLRATPYSHPVWLPRPGR